MGVWDALDRLDRRVLDRYPWLWRAPKRQTRFSLLLVLALGLTQSLTRLTHGGTWTDVGEYLVKYLIGMVLLAPLFVVVFRTRARWRALRGGEPPD